MLFFLSGSEKGRKYGLRRDELFKVRLIVHYSLFFECLTQLLLLSMNTNVFIPTQERTSNSERRERGKENIVI